MLDKWIPKEKREKGAENNNRGLEYNIHDIPGIDTAKGIAMTGGTMASYIQVLSIFCKDARDRMPLLQNMPVADTLSEYIINVHALKSASASIGAQEISSLAAQLEAAGKAGDTTFIGEHLLLFAGQLAALVDNIQDALEPGGEEYQDVQQGAAPAFPAFNSQLLNELADALKSRKIHEIKSILKTLEGQTQDLKLKRILEQISDQVLMTEFDNALKIVEKLINAKN